VNDWHDRWVDAGLQELHGSRPPDLSARVLLALHETPVGALPTLRRARRRPLRYLLAAAALVLVGIAVGALLPRPHVAGEGQVARIALQVHDGELLCIEVEADGVRRASFAAGAPIVFAARAGNRLQTAMPSRFQVGPFGELATGPATELEVRSMTVNWKHGVFAASSLTIAVVAGVVTWHSLSQGGTAKAGDVLHLEAGGAADGSHLAAEVARLREQLQKEQEKNANLQASLAREQVPPAVVEEPPPPPPPEPVVAETGPVFTDDLHGDALAALDWKLMGEVTNEMGPMLVDLVAALEKGEELPMDVLAKIQELNSKLVAQVPAMMKADLPGSGENGAYTHPLVAANILAKTLDAAGLSMDAAQRAEIAGLVRSFSAEARAVADSVQDVDLARVAAEAETKDRFYREVSSRLTPEQYKVMFPDGAEKFDGTSLFHSSLFTRQFTEAVPASNPAEFARSVSFKLGEQIGLDEGASGQVRAIVERMSTAPELWQDKGSSVETGLHMLRSGRAQAAMRNQIAIMREIARQVPMTPAQKKQFLAMKHLLVPLPR
jgi:hypothetical protein